MRSQQATPTIGLSPTEFSQRAGVGKTLIYAQIKIGSLPAHKLGTRTIIFADEGEEWLRSLPRVKRASPEVAATIVAPGGKRIRRNSKVGGVGRQP